MDIAIYTPIKAEDELTKVLSDANEIRNYLEWRYRVNNIPKYQKYCDEWIRSIPSSNLWYYEIEIQHLRANGKYYG